jgi:hypothetical protein
MVVTAVLVVGLKRFTAPRAAIAPADADQTVPATVAA